LVQSKLAGTLEAIAAHGPAVFYAGPVGKAWLETMHEFGSRITADDLATYVPETTPALSSERNGLEVATSPPNSQGLLLLMSLGLVDKRESVLDPLSEQAAVLAEIFRAATEVRSAHLADPRFAEVPVHEIVAGLQVAASGRGSPRAGHGDTVALVTADGEGRAVSLIQSLFDSFGVGVLDQRTGILTHNRGTFFSLDPRSPNILEPGKRPVHTLTPVIVSEGGQLRYVLGTMGGLAQTQILTQVMLHLQRGRSPEEAVALPRWTVGGIEASSSQVPIQAEGRVPTTAIEALATAGWPIVRLEDFDFQAGEAQVIEHLPDGRLIAASDPRSDGTALAEGPG
jgi:gamma-glutamyltranspeptidase